jgi:hypothetical protein
LESVEAKPSFDTSCAVTIYVQTPQFEDIYKRIGKASLSISDVTVQQGRQMFRCLDP